MKRKKSKFAKPYETNKEIKIQRIRFDKGCEKKEEGEEMNELKVVWICLEENNFWNNNSNNEGEIR